MPLHPRSSELAAALKNCLTWAEAWEGTAYRFVTLQYANRQDLLSGAGSRRNGARWNPPGEFNVIYGSLDPETAMAESLGTFSAFGVPPEKARPRVFVAIQLKLQAVLDLTTAQAGATHRIEFKQLAKENWQDLQNRGDESLSQAIGRTCWELRLEAILVPSFRKARGDQYRSVPGAAATRQLMEDPRST